MHNTPATPRSIDATIARSWLLVNAIKTDLFDPADQSDADQIILDIEDAVDPKLKPSARDGVAIWLQDKSAWVRINDRSTPFWSDDVDVLKGLPGLVGVVLAKTESADHVTETFDRLGGTTPVLALIESALGIEEAATIARARGVLRLAFGSGDYRRDTGASSDDLAMAYPRSRLVIASRIGDLPGPIDGPTVSNSHRVLREQSAVTGVTRPDRQTVPRPRATTGDQRSPQPHPIRRGMGEELPGRLRSPRSRRARRERSASARPGTEDRRARRRIRIAPTNELTGRGRRSR